MNLNYKQTKRNENNSWAKDKLWKKLRRKLIRLLLSPINVEKGETHTYQTHQGLHQQEWDRRHQMMLHLVDKRALAKRERNPSQKSLESSERSRNCSTRRGEQGDASSTIFRVTLLCSPPSHSSSLPLDLCERLKSEHSWDLNAFNPGSYHFGIRARRSHMVKKVSVAQMEKEESQLEEFRAEQRQHK